MRLSVSRTALDPGFYSAEPCVVPLVLCFHIDWSLGGLTQSNAVHLYEELALGGASLLVYLDLRTEVSGLSLTISERP